MLGAFLAPQKRAATLRQNGSDRNIEYVPPHSPQKNTLRPAMLAGVFGSMFVMTTCSFTFEIVMPIGVVGFLRRICTTSIFAPAYLQGFGLKGSR